MTAGGIILPEGDKDVLEKKYNIGQVISVGPDVKLLRPGDIVLYQMTVAWRIPNGIDGTALYRGEENPFCVIGVLPPLEPYEPLDGSNWLSERKTGEDAKKAKAEPVENYWTLKRITKFVKESIAFKTCKVSWEAFKGMINQIRPQVKQGSLHHHD